MASELEGAGKGAATGAAIGSVVPGIGTAIGAVGGAVIGGVGTMISNQSKAAATRKANARLAELARQYDIDVNGEDRIARFLSPDAAYRQQAVTQALSQLYGNSGAINSSGAQRNIASANAHIAAQAWDDAFNRNKAALDSQLGIQTNMAGNALSQRMNEQSLLSGLAQGAGIAGQIIGGGK